MLGMVHMKKTMKRIGAIAVAVAAMTAAVGCGSGAGTQKTASGTANLPKEVNESAENKNATGNVAQRETVNVGIEADPADLSPFGPETTGRTAVVDCLYETLGYMEDGQFHGVLAKDYVLSEDETTLTFHLYENIYDQAGNPFTASDVVFSYESKVKTGNFFNVDFIKGVKAVDATTVEFQLNPPLKVTNIANLVHNLYCVTEAAYQASSDGMVTNGIVSTSHYKVTDYQGGYLLTLDKWEDYWQKDASMQAKRSAANVNTIHYYVLAESNQRTMALENKTIDMCWSVNNDDIQKLAGEDNGSAAYWIYQNSDNLSLELLFNQGADHLTADENLRKAIGHAIQAEAILSSVYNGYGEVIYDSSRAKSTGYENSWQTQDNFYQYDLEKAKAALAESGYQGETLSLLTNTDTSSTDTAALIQGLCSAAGIDLKIQTVDSANVNTYFADETAWDLYLTKSAAETYVVQSWMKHLDSNTSTGKTLSFFKDDTLQGLLTKAVNVETSNADTIQACHDYIVEHALIRGLVNPYDCYVVPGFCKQVVLGYKVEILPGACVYTE